MAKLTKVIFKPSGRSITIIPETNLHELITKLELDFPATCGGKGKCGKCKVMIENGGERLKSYSDLELRLLSSEEKTAGYRLACTLAVPEAPHFVVSIPKVARPHKARLQVEGVPASAPLEPVMKKYLIKVPAATLEDNRSDETRLLATLSKKYGLECRLAYEAVTALPSVMTSGESEVTCDVWGDDLVISVESGDTLDKNLGFAVDIGTTKLAGYLIDLNNGQQLASSSLTNPQSLYGEDVMSRIAFAMASKANLITLQKAIIGGINRLISDCCQQAGKASRWIYEACLVGNTCMTHLFLGVSPKNLALSPYHAVLDKAVSLEARGLPTRLALHPNARIYVLPVIAGFVGADNVAAQLAVSQVKSEKVRMLLDIGTNTEIALMDAKGTMVCSCASGPAFEGMHITYGRRADSGTIERIRIDPETLEAEFKTIGDARPVGICGSGIVDAVAELVKAGVIKPNGKMNQELSSRTPRLRQGSEGELEFVIAWEAETDIKSDIVITQGDINEIQKAKAAIHTGCTLLMEQKGITEKDIEELLIAGAFGQYMDKNSARTIGMFPEIALDQIRDVGNAAGTGARLALVSRKERQKAEDIARTARYYELATDPKFTGEYGRSLFFPYFDLGRYPETKNYLGRAY